MPYRRKAATRKRSTRKRVTFRRSKTARRATKRRRGTSALVVRSTQLPFPRKAYVKLHGIIEGSINTATTLPVLYNIMGNEINAPFNPGTNFGAINFPNSYQNLAALQPVGLNQYMISNLGATGAQGIYQNYKVNGVGIELLCTAEAAFGGTGVQSQQLFDVTVVPLKTFAGQAESLQPAGLDNIDSASIVSLPYSKTVTINPYQNRSNMLKKYYSIRKLYGMSKEGWRVTDAMLSSNIANLGLRGPFVGGRNCSPINLTFIFFMIKPMNPGQVQNNFPISYKLKATYYVEFLNPIVNQYPNAH